MVTEEKVLAEFKRQIAKATTIEQCRVSERCRDALIDAAIEFGSYQPLPKQSTTPEESPIEEIAIAQNAEQT